jgi:hypothetical protein
MAYFKAQGKKILILPIVLLGVILMINFVSALEFDNIKTTPTITKGESYTLDKVAIPYNDIWEKYNPIEINNAFGLGEKLFAGAIVQHDETCGIDCKSTMQLYLANDGILIDDINFYTIMGEDKILQSIRSYQFYIKTSEKDIEVNDYEWTCTPTGKININGTEEQTCENKLIGTHIEKEPIWIPYNLGTEVDAGVYEIKLEGQKKPDRSVDWVIKTQGIYLNDWATWETSPITNNINSYYKFDEGSGNIASNIANLTFNNLTSTSGNWDTGKINQGIKLPTYFNVENTQTFTTMTIAGWMNMNSGAVSDNIFNLGVGSTTIFAGGTGKLRCMFKNSENTENSADDESISQVNTGAWVYVACIYNGTSVNTYFNGALEKTSALTGTLIQNVNYQFGNGLTGSLDEWGIWNRALSSSEISTLYNSYSGSQYPFLQGTVTINSPANNYISPTNSVDFNCSASVTGGATLTNMSLWTNSTGTWALNQTLIKTGATNTSIFTNSYANADSILWTCQACDSDGDCGFASENRTVSIDTNAPNIVINSGSGSQDYGSLSNNYTINYTISDSNLDSCYIQYPIPDICVWGGVGSCYTHYISCSDGVSYETNFTLIPYSGYAGRDSAKIFANDSAGNLDSVTFNWNFKVFENLINYSASAIATSNQTFITNLTYNSSNWISASAVLNYNGTNYISSKTETTNNLIFTNSLIIPNILTQTNYNFFWNISLTNSSGTFNIITTTNYQSVSPLQSINITSSSCPAGFSPAFNFTSLIESNLSEINFTTVDYNLQYGSTGNSSALTAYGSLSNIKTFNICINSSSEYTVGYGEIQYQVSGYSNRRFYIFQNTRLSNTTISNNLYSLETGSSTAFQITATNTGLNPYVDYYISLLRWYPNLNTYKIVEMGKTDDQGQTVLNVKTNDVDYRLGLYSSDGTLIKLLDPIRMVCQTTPCVYSLIVDLSGVDLTTFLNIQSSLTFDKTTKVFSYIFNDPSQDTTSMNLTVYQDYANAESQIVCSQSSSSFTGVLVCDVSAYTGQLRAEVYRQASPPILIAQLLADLRSTFIDLEGGKTISLFIGLILVVTMALMGVVSPPLVVILSVIAIIPLMFLGAISISVFIIIGTIGGIILHMMRRIS